MHEPVAVRLRLGDGPAAERADGVDEPARKLTVRLEPVPERLDISGEREVGRLEADPDQLGIRMPVDPDHTVAALEERRDKRAPERSARSADEGDVRHY